MKNKINRAINCDSIADILLQKRKLPRVDMRDIVAAAGDEIIDRDNFVACCQTTIRKMRPQKSGAAGDDNSHLLWFLIFDF